MPELITKYLAVFFASMFKIIGGPLLGVATGLSFIESVIFTILGMMATVVLLTGLIGKRLKIFIVNYLNKDRRLFTRKNRMKVKIWRTYGLKGVAFLTPVLFSPPGGALLAATFGDSFKKVFFYMLLSAVFWSFVYSFIIYFIKDIVL